MAEISRVALFGKLNRLAYRAIEAATVFCKMRGNPYVELVHWFHQILQLQDSDLHKLIKHFQMDPARLVKDLTENLDKLPRVISLSLDGDYPAVLDGFARIGLTFTRRIERIAEAYMKAVEAAMPASPGPAAPPKVLQAS